MLPNEQHNLKNIAEKEEINELYNEWLNIITYLYIIQWNKN